MKPSQTETPLILTLDIGTSSTRAMLFDRLARPLQGMQAQIPNHLHTTPDGGAELDPAQILANVTTAIDQLLNLAGPLAGQIAGVAMDTLVTNIMGLDATGQPVTPIFTYADTRNVPDAEILARKLDLSAVHDRTGCRIHSSYLPALFHWLARTHSHWLQTALHWVSIGEYLFEEFLGQRVVSYSVASWSGLLNRHNLIWDQTWLSHLPLTEAHFSPLSDINQPLLGLKPDWAQRWPALKEVPWFPALGDGAAANIGSGCDAPHQVALTIGTSGAMRAVLDRPLSQVPDGLWLYRVDKRRTLLGGATTEGGSIFAWLNQTLQLPPNVEQALLKLEPAAHGLTMLPFLAGERAPGWRGDARASLIGFTLNTRPIDILRAGLEAVAYRFALIHQRIAPYLPSDHQIIASGAGLLNSPAWLQIMTDVLGRPLTASAEKEATSRGAALLALEALGLHQDRPAAIAKTYQPNRDHHTRYQQALQHQIRAYQKLILD